MATTTPINTRAFTKATNISRSSVSPWAPWPFWAFRIRRTPIPGIRNQARERRTGDQPGSLLGVGVRLDTKAGYSPTRGREANHALAGRFAVTAPAVVEMQGWG